jgi:hypothetical protein
MTNRAWEAYALAVERLSIEGDRAAVRELVKAFSVVRQLCTNALDERPENNMESFWTDFEETLLGCFGEFGDDSRKISGPPGFDPKGGGR